MEKKHIPVLLTKVIDTMNIKSNGNYIDLTLGRGGHSSAILKKLTTGMLYCFDKDETAIKESGLILKKISNNFCLIHSDFKNFKNELEKREVFSVDGIIADLGVSSPQLDDAHRGFSFRKKAKLDMRMDQSQTLSAYEVVNSWSEDKLVDIFRSYADVKPAKQVAKGIISNRPIVYTTELTDVINKSLSAKATRLKNYPKVVFQAIRIAVNDEINALKQMIDDAIGMLNPLGKLSIITFHSLEDRVVKKVFGHLIKDDTGKLPIIKETLYKVKTYKPSELEIQQNKRARSSKLRVLTKCG